MADPETKRCAIIDPVLDFDLKSGATATHSADQLLSHIEREGYELEWILDTHPMEPKSAKDLVAEASRELRPFQRMTP